MNSKSIGNNYERAFSYKLSEWLTGEKDADVCWRDLSSGSRHTQRKKTGKDTSHKADIVCTDSKYEEFFKLFYIDTKSYKNFYSLIINQSNIKSNDIFHQWVKTVKECPQEMYPMMPCYIRDRKKTEFIIFKCGTLFNISNFIKYHIFYENEVYDFVLVFQDEFFEKNNWLDFIKKNK